MGEVQWSCDVILSTARDLLFALEIKAPVNFSAV
jgi:hypothetical protein